MCSVFFRWSIFVERGSERARKSKKNCESLVQSLAVFPIANMFNILLAANVVCLIIIVGEVHAQDNSGFYDYERRAIPNRTIADEGKKGFIIEA